MICRRAKFLCSAWNTERVREDAIGDSKDGKDNELLCVMDESEGDCIWPLTNLPANWLQFFWLHQTVDHSEIHRPHIGVPYCRTSRMFLSAVTWAEVKWHSFGIRYLSNNNNLTYSCGLHGLSCRKQCPRWYSKFYRGNFVRASFQSWV